MEEIHYFEGKSPPTDALLALYRDVGWSAYTQNPEGLQAAVAGSRRVLSACKGKELVGLLRTVGDGISIAYVQDILVRSDCQRQGIGTKLVQRLLESSPERQLVLLTDDTLRTTAFYESLGLRRAAAFGCAAFVRYQ